MKSEGGKKKLRGGDEAEHAKGCAAGSSDFSGSEL